MLKLQAVSQQPVIVSILAWDVHPKYQRVK